MNFFETPLRRLRIVRACGFLILALVIGLLPFVMEVDKEGALFGYAGAGFCVLLGMLNFWLARRTSPDEIVTKIPERMPVPVRLNYYRRMGWLSAFLFPTLTIW